MVGKICERGQHIAVNTCYISQGMRLRKVSNGNSDLDGHSSSLPAALREAQTCRYLIYSEADFEVFRPAGATRCTDGGEIWHGGGDRFGPLLHAKFHPTGVTTRV